MALDRATRNTLRNTVTRCRGLLEEAVGDVLEGRLGIRRSGEVEDAARMTHLSEEEQRHREQVILHLRHIEAGGLKSKDAVARLVREASYTHLNRLCAYKMLERRGLRREAVGRGINSQGFMFYLADHPEDERLYDTGRQDEAYRNFLRWLGGTLSEEIGVLFSSTDPAHHLFPPQRVLDAVLDLINAEELNEVWDEEETIGWVYQYYTPKELKDKARKESQAPRSSYELAFRNQFYTPDYVVRFLTDNTLGRTWYEMRGGNTRLIGQCESLVRRPDEIFLAEDSSLEIAEAQRWLQGEDVPEPNVVHLGHTVNGYSRVPAFGEGGNRWIEERLPRLTGNGVAEYKTQELLDLLFLFCRKDRFAEGTLDDLADEVEAIMEVLRGRVDLSQRDGLSQDERLQAPVFIPYRAPKDPRELKILDPACGSGHFLLYCFDLLQTIYEEAYDDENLGEALQEEYPDRDEFRRAVPALILRHNLHGVDIDVRATQIAALALWLRAQRAYGELGLRDDERPRITRSNIVCAEPMPGEHEMLEEFARSLEPTVLGQLVEVVFDEMKLAGEAGFLLKIEEEIEGAIARARAQWQREFDRATDRRGNELLLTHSEMDRLSSRANTQMDLFDVSQVTDEEFWAQAEGLVIEALRSYSTGATNGESYQRKLFADDAAQGFAFVDICRKSFDVVLMNPPFGSPTAATSGMLTSGSGGNLYAAFVINAMKMCRGFVGAITDRSFLAQDSFKDFRTILVAGEYTLEFLIDLGWGVLDTADVQVAAYTVRAGSETTHCFMDARKGDNKEDIIEKGVNRPLKWSLLTDSQLNRLPNRVFAYNLPRSVLNLLTHSRRLTDIAVLPRGLGSNKAFRTYKAWYEVPDGSIGPHGRYRSLCNGGGFSPFFREDSGVADWVRSDGLLLVSKGYADGFAAYDQKNYEHYFSAGLSFPKQSTVFNVAALSIDAIPTREGKAIVPYSSEYLWPLLGYLNSSLIRYFVEATTGLHKQSGAIGMVPVPELPSATWNAIGEIAQGLTLSYFKATTADESSRLFVVPWQTFSSEEETTESDADVYGGLDELIADALEFDGPTRNLLREGVPEPESPFVPSAGDLLSYCLGCVFGRWDVRIALDPSLGPQLADPFAPLPGCPPGSLVGPDGLPASRNVIASEEWMRARPDAITPLPKGSVENSNIPDTEYPLALDWDGILVDDPEHDDDILCRVRDVLDLLWGEHAVEIEGEACDLLGVKDLRTYFRNPRQFFEHHIKRYSKSRRKAPIYWLLQSPKRNYGLWLYYHRLDPDILFKALHKYTEPKVRLEESRLEEYEARRRSAGTGGREAKQAEKAIEKQEELLTDLREFRDRLEHAAKLHLRPDLNDGVALNTAPLHELLPQPWKEAKSKWNELLSGKYEWSSIGKQLREKGMV